MKKIVISMAMLTLTSLFLLACASVVEAHPVTNRTGNYKTTYIIYDSYVYDDEMWEDECSDLNFKSATECVVYIGTCYEAETGEGEWVRDSSEDYSEYDYSDYFYYDEVSSGTTLDWGTEEYSDYYIEWEYVAENCDTPDADGITYCDIYYYEYVSVWEYEVANWCSVQVTEWYETDRLTYTGAGSAVNWPDETALREALPDTGYYDSVFSGTIIFYANENTLQITKNFSSAESYISSMSAPHWIAVMSNDKLKLCAEEPEIE